MRYNIILGGINIIMNKYMQTANELAKTKH